MSPTCEGRPATGAPAESDAATTLLDLASDDTGTAPSAADLLRQLGRDVIGCGHLLGADDRLRAATLEAADLVAAGRVSRTAAATVLSVAAQASGIGQADALAVIREAFAEVGVK